MSFYELARPKKKDGIYFSMSDPEYRQVRRLSKSIMEKCRPGNSRPSMLRLRLAYDGILPFKKTDQMRFGNAFDTYILERPWFDAHYHIEPDFGDRRSKKELQPGGNSKEARELFRQRVQFSVTPRDMSRIKAMEESLASHPACRLLKNRKGAQASVFWHWGKTPLKARLDKLCPDNKQPLIVDMKSVAEVEDGFLRRQIMDLGYHRQAAMYSDGIEAVTGKKPLFWFIFVEHQFPYEVRVVELPEKAERSWHPDLEKGRESYQKTLQFWEMACEKAKSEDPAIRRTAFGHAWEEVNVL